MKLVTVEEMRAVEKEANAAGMSYETMMDNAGRGLARIVAETYSQLDEKVVLGLVGVGNNGGDTLVALAELKREGWRTLAYLSRARKPEDALVLAYLQTGGELTTAEDDPKMEILDGWLRSAGLLLDGLLGTGVQPPLKPDVADLLEHVRRFQPSPRVVAVDCPSGVDCDSGQAAAQTLTAELTVCMQAVKTGLLRFPAYALVGELMVVDLGLPEPLAGWNSLPREVVSGERVKSILPTRPINAHKGSFGTAVVAAGSLNYTGAALLAGRGAYRMGAGLVRLAVPAPLHGVLAGQLPEATWVLLPHEMGVIAEAAADVLLKNLDRASALLLGPGWGTDETTAKFLKALLEGRRERSSRAGIGFLNPQDPTDQDEPRQSLPPVVVDADGLRLLAQLTDWPHLLPAPAVLTPHPGEMAVLCGMEVSEIQQERLLVAERFAREWGHVLVLKGALTVVASPDGRTGVVPIATPALARAGSGDVLAGFITGLRAQGLPAYEAALAGAWLHAQCGLQAEDWLGSSASVLAGDLIEVLPEVLRWLQ